MLTVVIPVFVAIWLFYLEGGKPDPKYMMLGAITVLFSAIYVYFLRRPTLLVAEEVSDCGDSLLVKVGAESVRIPLSDIESLHVTNGLIYKAASVNLSRPAPFGQYFLFSLAQSSELPSISDAMQDLDRRIKSANSQRVV